MKLIEGKITIIEDNIKNFKYKVRIDGIYEGSSFVLWINWNPGYNTPEEVLKLANYLIS
jgi:hypothetical protein